jgi:Ca-activated chloride channel family protein
MNFAHPHFAEPQWLWLALLAPLAALALLRFSARRRRHQLAAIASPAVLPALTRSHSPVRRSVKHLLLVLAMACMGLALARPQWGETTDAGRLLGEDVVFLLDTSRSMLATDVLPNRLQRAKLGILDFVQTARGRVGLVVFSGQAFLQCPLTFDYGAFREALLAVDERTIPVPGTDIGRALDEGQIALEKGSRQKILILITDGEDLEKHAADQAQKLAREGVVVFSLGVGTEAGAEIEFINEQGQRTLVRDPQGQVVRSRLDETTLRAIAQTTRGAYHPLGPLGEGLASVRLAVDQLDGLAGSAPARKLGVDRFHYPVAVALGLLVAESLIGTRRRVRDTAAA